MAAWRATGAPDGISAVSDELSAVQDGMTAYADDLSAGIGTSSPLSDLDSAAGQLQSAALQAQSQLPPACLPGMRTADSTALTAATFAATGTENAVTKADAGKNETAASGLLAAKKQITVAMKRLDAGVTDAQQYGGSG